MGGPSVVPGAEFRTEGISARRRLPRVAPVVVGGAWAVLLAGALTYVGRYGSNVPSWDDWDMVPALTGHQPVTVEWLWSQHNEHRVPLPRLIMLGLGRLFGGDFRAGMYFNVLTLGLLALALVLTARRLRGRVSYADAFFPLLMLHAGHGSNYLWSWQITQILPTALGGAFLIIVARQGAPGKPGSILPAGLCLLALPLCGVNGLVLVPALAAWLVYAGVSLWRTGTPRGRLSGTLALGPALASLLLLGAYFVGYQPVPYHTTSTGLRVALKGVAQFLAISFGPAAAPLWKWSALAVVGLCLPSAGLLTAVGLCRPGERHRAGGFLLFLVALGCLALGVGLGRPSGGLEGRYAVFIAPLLAGVYLIWTAYGPPVVGRCVRYALCGLGILALWPNTRIGMDYGRNLRSHLSAFERDLVDGAPPSLLFHRHGQYLHPHPDVPTEYLPMLHQAGVGLYRCLRPDPAFRETALPLTPSETHELAWAQGTARATGTFPYLVFTLPEERYVAGIRLRYDFPEKPDTLPYLSLFWRSEAQRAFDTGHYCKYSPTGDRANWASGTWARRGEPERTFTVWVYGRVRAIRVHPDFKPCVFAIAEVALLEPAGGDKPEEAASER